MPFSLDKTWKKVTAILGTLSIIIGMTYTVFQVSTAVATDAEVDVKLTQLAKMFNNSVEANQKAIISNQRALKASTEHIQQQFLSQQIMQYEEKIDDIQGKEVVTPREQERVKGYERKVRDLERQLKQVK